MAEDDKNSIIFKDMSSKLSTLEDLQNLVQLDIINLKNEVDKLNLVSTSPVSAEVGERIAELERLSKDVELFKRWKQTVDEVKFLRERLISAPPSPVPVPPVRTELKPPKPLEKLVEPKEIEEIKRSIEQLRKDMRPKRSVATPAIDTDDLKAAIEENKKAVETLKIMITEKSRTAVPDLESIRRMTSENRRLIDDLRMRIENSRVSFPADTHRGLDELHKEVTKLEDEVRRIKEEKPVRIAPKDDIEHLRRELFTKLDDLNIKFGPRSSEDVRKAMEANKASIDKLKSLISGEETSIEGLKSELDENRKFMAEVKNIILSKKPAGAKKVIVPMDAEVRNKMANLEERIGFLGRKLEKMSEIKPIKLPDFTPSAGKGKAPRPDEVEGIRKEIDVIVNRMDGFLTKDEVEKGFLEKHLKADEKLMTGEIYKEMNEIKKAIIRNEDHIHSVASDVEGIKKEVGTVEKREWGKVTEIPSIEDLKHRIDTLEKKIDSLQEGPVFIE